MSREQVVAMLVSEHIAVGGLQNVSRSWQSDLDVFTLSEANPACSNLSESTSGLCAMVRDVTSWKEREWMEITHLYTIYYRFQSSFTIMAESGICRIVPLPDS